MWHEFFPNSENRAKMPLIAGFGDCRRYPVETGM
jgi:hypothetical protein